MFSRCVQFIKEQKGSLTLLAITVVLCVTTVALLIWPAYKNPSSRMFTSRLGYASVLRSTGKPFPVTTALATRRQSTGVFLGEGLIQSEPVQVPMIAMAGIQKIHVQQGDRVTKGQLLVELDETKIQLRIAAAQAALDTARAEQERVKVGSVNILLDERPELDQIQLEAAETTAQSESALLRRYEHLYKNGSISDKQLLQQRVKAKDAEVLLRKLRLRKGFAAKGKENSLRIAEATIREAEMAWKHRVAQLADYKSYAPSDGVVEQVLVHEGEYNQDPGRPAMLIASGIWFEANLDQTALGQVAVGNRVEIRLSAFQDRVLYGTIERINPMVNFSLGGPETNRPIRPLGTGAPEWPATFAVRVSIDDTDTPIVPGLTGFARVTNQRTNIAVPQGTVTSVSGNRGIVHVVDTSGQKSSPRNVTIGWTHEGWTEILSGLKENERVIVDGYQVLEPGDQIACQPMNPPTTEVTLSSLDRERNPETSDGR